MDASFKTALRRSAASIRGFAADRGGNFAMLSAIAMLPLLGAAGLAIDYTNLSRARSDFQQAMDSAVLAVAREGKDISEADAERIARKAMAGNFDLDYTDLAVARTGSTVNLTATLHAPIIFGGIFGYDTIDINGVASADVALVAYEIAMVLDTTGSMGGHWNGSKLEDMQTAAKDLVDDLSDQVPDKDNLKFALVPFSTFVNVGPEYGPEFNADGSVKAGTGAQWLDLYGKSEIPQIDLKAGISRFALFNHLGKDWKGCVETRDPTPSKAHDVDDTAAGQDEPASLFVPAFAIDEPRHHDNDYLVFNRYEDPDALDDSPAGQARKLGKYGVPKNTILELVPGLEPGDLEDLGLGHNDWTEPTNTNYGWNDQRGPNRQCTSRPITPLDNDYEALKTEIDAFEAEGTTNIMEGVAWGARVLSERAPFAGGEDRPGLEKVMIVLTDGANNFGSGNGDLGSEYSSFGFLVDDRIDAGSTWSASQKMNEKTLAACQAAKDDGVLIYTIRVENNDTGTDEMLKKCATSESMYYDTQSSDNLDAVFKSIGERIVKLRLSS